MPAPALPCIAADAQARPVHAVRPAELDGFLSTLPPAQAGYLRDIAWPHGGAIDLVQGEDMGMRSRLRAEIPAAKGSSIRVSGTARMMEG